MSKWFAVLVLLVALLLPAHAMAQNAIGFDSLDVSVWPEYDTPTVLVIYKISLTADTTFPAEINLKFRPMSKKCLLWQSGRRRMVFLIRVLNTNLHQVLIFHNYPLKPRPVLSRWNIMIQA